MVEKDSSKAESNLIDSFKTDPDWEKHGSPQYSKDKYSCNDDSEEIESD